MERFKEIIKELTEDKRMFTLIVYTVLFWGYAIVVFGYMTYHNFYKNTPERFADPLNWMGRLNTCTVYSSKTNWKMGGLWQQLKLL